jgi:putative membrane protein insertion efficiency factor
VDNEAAASFRQASARPVSAVRTAGGIAAPGFHRYDYDAGICDREEGRQRRGPQPAPAPSARGGAAYAPPLRDVLRPRHPGGNGPLLSATVRPPMPSGGGTDRSGPAGSRRPARGPKAGNLGLRTPHTGGAITLTSAPASRPTITTKALRTIVLAYQAASAGRSPACRFVPSCSDYALEALQTFGTRKGIPLVVRRLARCRPGGPFGLDPVPESPSREGTGPESPAPDGSLQDGPLQDGPLEVGLVLDDLVSHGHGGAEKRST